MMALGGPMSWFQDGQTVLAIATLVKIVIAALKAGVDAPRWAAPALAVLAGVGLSALVPVAQGTTLTPQLGAQAILQGVLAAGVALGIAQIETQAALRAARVTGLRGK